MAWVKGVVHGAIHRDGTIECDATDLVVIEGQRPKSIEEAGSDAGVFDDIRTRTPGRFITSAFLGGATALLVPWKSLVLLDQRSMGLLQVKYGIAEWPEWALALLVRNSAAPAIQNAAEPAGGMAETPDLLLEQLKEIAELCVFNDMGCREFALPRELHEHDDAFQSEQRAWWSHNGMRAGNAMPAALTMLDIGRDRFNDRRGVVTVGPVGDLSFLTLARLQLDGVGWRLCDTECRPGRPGEQQWMPLRRTVMVVVPRTGKSPIGLEFGEDGGLHPCGIHVALSGEARDLNLTHLGRAAIEALGWA